MHIGVKYYEESSSGLQLIHIDGSEKLCSIQLCDKLNTTGTFFFWCLKLTGKKWSVESKFVIEQSLKSSLFFNINGGCWFVSCITASFLTFSFQSFSKCRDIQGQLFFKDWLVSLCYGSYVIFMCFVFYSGKWVGSWQCWWDFSYIQRERTQTMEKMFKLRHGLYFSSCWFC